MTSAATPPAPAVPVPAPTSSAPGGTDGAGDGDNHAVRPPPSDARAAIDEFAQAVTACPSGDRATLRTAMIGLIGPTMHVIDLGCGTGELALAAVERGATVTAVDVSRKQIAKARQRTADDWRVGRITIVESSMLDYQAPVGRTDFVVCSLSLSELKSLEVNAVLHRIFQWLKPGGRLVVIEQSPIGRLHGVFRRWLRGALYFAYPVRRLSHPLADLPAALRHIGFALPLVRPINDGRWVAIVADRPPETAGAEANSAERRPAVLPSVGEIVGDPTRFRRTAALICPWLTFGRQPGLYRVGDPQTSAPILVTGNPIRDVAATMRRAASGGSAWVLVVDTLPLGWRRNRGSLGLTSASILATLDGSQTALHVDSRHVWLPAHLPHADEMARAISDRSEWHATVAPA